MVEDAESKVTDSKARSTSAVLDNPGKVTSWVLPKVGSRGKVIRTKEKDEKALRARGNQEIIEDYKKQTKPKPLTAQELQQIADDAKKEGYVKGYEEGKSKGYKDGLTQGEKKGNEKAYQECKKNLLDETRRFKELADALLHPVKDQDGHLEDVLMDLVLGISQHVVESEIQSDPEKLYRIICKAVSVLPIGAKNIQVYLNHSDMQLMQTHFTSETEDWQFVEDQSLQSGGCKIATQESFIDFSLECRLKGFLEESQNYSESIADPIPQYSEKLNKDFANGAEISVEEQERPPENQNAIDKNTDSDKNG